MRDSAPTAADRRLARRAEVAAARLLRLGESALHSDPAGDATPLIRASDQLRNFARDRRGETGWREVPVPSDMPARGTVEDLACAAEAEARRLGREAARCIARSKPSDRSCAAWTQAAADLRRYAWAAQRRPRGRHARPT